MLPSLSEGARRGNARRSEDQRGKSGKSNDSLLFQKRDKFFRTHGYDAPEVLLISHGRSLIASLPALKLSRELMIRRTPDVLPDDLHRRFLFALEKESIHGVPVRRDF